MVFDLNQAEEQKEFLGAIPPGSMVKVKLTIKQPKNPGSDPCLSVTKNGLEQLGCEFEVVSGTFKGKKMWENYGITGAKTEGHQKNIQISMRSLRAMVEASRGISPKDQSPAATKSRMLESVAELNGLEFGIVVDCEKPSAGDRYVNNTIKKIITPDHDDFYAKVMAGGEFISAEPVPQIPEGNPDPKPDWASAQGAAAPATSAPASGAKPNWM